MSISVREYARRNKIPQNRAYDIAHAGLLDPASGWSQDERGRFRFEMPERTTRADVGNDIPLVDPVDRASNPPNGIPLSSISGHIRRRIDHDRDRGDDDDDNGEDPADDTPEDTASLGEILDAASPSIASRFHLPRRAREVTIPYGEWILCGVSIIVAFLAVVRERRHHG